ncbi:hypothetical protein [Burkholderia phage FLC9]|nr:hypothetical protein [Burkholderia phage FLC9]
MYPFLDTQLNTLLGLINQSNPGLQVAPLSMQNLQTLVPTAITPVTGTIQDTSLRLLTVQGNGRYVGNQTVTYRRINLATLFRSMVLTLDDYIGSTTMTAAQFCTAFNNKYGTELVPTDFANTTFTSGTSYTVSMLAGSLCYSGSFTVKWTQGAPYMNQKITNQVLVGKLYPGGNTFGGGRKPQADVLSYGLDCSKIRTSLLAIASSGTYTPAQWSATGSALATILGFLQQNLPSLNLSSADSATAGGLANLLVTRLTLPSASALGANSNKFANVVLITAVAGSWFQGSFYLHFN